MQICVDTAGKLSPLIKLKERQTSVNNVFYFDANSVKMTEKELKKRCD